MEDPTDAISRVVFLKNLILCERYSHENLACLYKLAPGQQLFWNKKAEINKLKGQAERGAKLFRYEVRL